MHILQACKRVLDGEALKRPPKLGEIEYAASLLLAEAGLSQGRIPSANGIMTTAFRRMMILDRLVLDVSAQGYDAAHLEERCVALGLPPSDVRYLRERAHNPLDRLMLMRQAIVDSLETLGFLRQRIQLMVNDKELSAFVLERDMVGSPSLQTILASVTDPTQLTAALSDGSFSLPSSLSPSLFEVEEIELLLGGWIVFKSFDLHWIDLFPAKFAEYLIQEDIILALERVGFQPALTPSLHPHLYQDETSRFFVYLYQVNAERTFMLRMTEGRHDPSFRLMAFRGSLAEAQAWIATHLHLWLRNPHADRKNPVGSEIEVDSPPNPFRRFFGTTGDADADRRLTLELGEGRHQTFTKAILTRTL